jgi:uncharacterized protein (TIGR00369 family)
MSFQARSSKFADRVRSGFAGQQFMGFLGARLGTIEPGLVEIILPYREELTQQHGFFHGGATAALADNAAGFAAFSLMSDDEQPLSVEFKVNLVAKATGEKLIARGRVIRDGRNLKVCQTDVYAVTDGAETLCATALATIAALRGSDAPAVNG